MGRSTSSSALANASLPELDLPALCEALLDAIQPRVIIIADSELPATARASERLKERLARRKVLVLSTREVGAVSILFRPSGCEITTPAGQKFLLTDLPTMTKPIEMDHEEAAER